MGTLMREASAVIRGNLVSTHFVPDFNIPTTMCEKHGRFPAWSPILSGVNNGAIRRCPRFGVPFFNQGSVECAPQRGCCLLVS